MSDSTSEADRNAAKNGVLLTPKSREGTDESGNGLLKPTMHF